MRTILETQRLILRELCPNDFHEVCKLLQDNEVMYAYEGAFNGTEVREWLDRQIKRYAEDKVGLWGAVLKKTENSSDNVASLCNHTENKPFPK